MDLHTKDITGGYFFDFLGISQERANEIRDWVKFCWYSHFASEEGAKEYRLTTMLRNIGKEVHTPEELMLISTYLGRLMEMDCKNCSYKQIIKHLSAIGAVEIQEIDLTKPSPGDTLFQNIKDCLN